MEARKKLPIAVLLSGTGRTLANLLDKTQTEDLPVQIVAVASDRKDARGLKVAVAAGVPARVFLKAEYEGRCERDAELFEWVREHGARVLCLAGYLSLLDLSASRGLPVLNIHPALLPRFGGTGFYGDRVHAAVLAAKEKESGATVHLVDENYDEGQILARIKVPVLSGDDLSALSARVFAAECRLYPEVLRWVAEGSLNLRANRASGRSGPWEPLTLRHEE